MADTPTPSVSDAPPEPSSGSPAPKKPGAATPIAGAPPEAPATLEISGPTKIDEAVDHWFSVTFTGSVLANTTESWNLLCSAREELKKFLNNTL